VGTQGSLHLLNQAVEAAFEFLARMKQQHLHGGSFSKLSFLSETVP
jgi:hypothetical protein